MKKQAPGGHCGLGGKACSRTGGAGGVQGRRGSGATRRGKPTAVPARGAPSLARAPGGPRSPSRGGRTHSGGRGAGKGVKLARGGSSSNARTTALGKNATKPGETRPEALTDTRSRTGRPLTSAASFRMHVDRRGPAHFCSLRPVPAPPAGGGAPNAVERTWERLPTFVLVFSMRPAPIADRH
ncbi:unnamed protein product [Rangifer tarandus platyrhynchus]|uniref:Uncharacterized protein n=1 Tax=Rangifer tarandus platyrhynchus TaxID=3082113 RepID=A0AC59YFS8_RANTA